MNFVTTHLSFSEVFLAFTEGLLYIHETAKSLEIAFKKFLRVFDAIWEIVYFKNTDS